MLMLIMVNTDILPEAEDIFHLDPFPPFRPTTSGSRFG
jgi:hypothetical protein